MSEFSGPFDRRTTAIDRIADALCGPENPEDGTGNRITDSLERIATAVENGSGSGGGGSSGGSGILVANATWLLASNDPMREQYEAHAHEQDSEAIYHGRFVLDKTWSEIGNAPFAVVRIQSNETDVDMNGAKLFVYHPFICTLFINETFNADNFFIAMSSPFDSHSLEWYDKTLPTHSDSSGMADSIYGHWVANEINGYPSSGPIISYPSV